MTEILSVQNLFSVLFIIGFSVELTLGKDRDLVCTVHGVCHTAGLCPMFVGRRMGIRSSQTTATWAPLRAAQWAPAAPPRQVSYLRASYPEGNQAYLSVLANFPQESSSFFPYEGERQVLEFFLAAPMTLSTIDVADTSLSRWRCLPVSPTLITAFTCRRYYAGRCWNLFNVLLRSTRTTL